MPPQGPRHAVMGDDFGTELPHTEVPDEDITQEKNMARFSKTAEFKQLKTKMEQRIAFHMKYSPGSTGGATAFRDMPNEERGWRSLAADLVIEELVAIITAYEGANEVVKDAEEAKKRRRSEA